MMDHTKTRLSLLAYISIFVLPPVGFLIGWVGWDIRTGFLTALIIGVVLFLLGGIFLAGVKNLSWFSGSMPLIGATFYNIMPDFIPSPIDDTVVMVAGAMLTFTLWLRKQPETPKWVIFPLLLASLYTLVGGFIPGPVDELIVTAIAAGSSTVGVLQQAHKVKQISGAKSVGDSIS